MEAEDLKFRLVVADPFITNEGGHMFVQAELLSHAALLQGLDCMVLGGRSAQDRCKRIPSFHGVLDNISHLLFDASCTRSKWFQVPSKLRQVCQSYQQALFSETAPSCLRSGDVVYLQTITAYDLLCLAYTLYRNRALLKHLCIRICINFRFSYVVASRLLTTANAMIYRIIFRLLAGCGPEHISLMANSDVLKMDFEKIQPWRVQVIPDALAPNGRIFETLSPPELSANSFKISFIGSARWNKGFDVFVQLMQSIARQDPQTFEACHFFAQAYIQPQVKKERQSSEECLKALHELQKKHSNISIYENPLSREDYLALLQKSHLVLLPYKQGAYRAATSNVLVEAVQYGTVPLVTRNTWLGYEMVKHGLDDLCYDEKDVNDVLRVLRHATTHYTDIRRRMSSFRKEWQALHTAESLVKMLIPVFTRQPS